MVVIVVLVVRFVLLVWQTTTIRQTQGTQWNAAAAAGVRAEGGNQIRVRGASPPGRRLQTYFLGRRDDLGRSGRRRRRGGLIGSNHLLLRLL